MKLTALVARFAPRLRVLAGRGGLDRSVRWVHVTDLPDPSPYLKPGDMVLTNGVWHHGPADSEIFVSALRRAEVSALGYGLSAEMPQVPTDLISTCNVSDLPLFEIPAEMAFTEISEAVADHYADERQRNLIHALRRDQVLLSRVAQGATTSDMLTLVGKEHGLGLALIARGGIVLAETRLHDLPIGSALWEAVGRTRRSGAIQVGGVELSAFPILLQERVEAWLVCSKTPDRQNPAEEAAIDQLIAFLRVELAHARTKREFEQRLAAELLELIEGGEARAAEVATRLRSLGIEPQQALAAMAIETRQPLPNLPAWGMESIEAAFAAGGRRAIVGPSGSRAIAVVTVGPEEDLRKLGAKLREDLASQNLDALIGVGGLAGSGGVDLRRSVAQAESAVRVARDSGGRQLVASHTDVSSYSMLLGTHEPETRRAYVRVVLGALLEHDDRHHTQLVRTLDQYLSTGSNWQRAAERLHIHVNTLRYRIAQIERLTGRDLTSMEDRVSMYVALRASE